MRKVPATMLRDTGTAQSFILGSALPFSEKTYCGSDVFVQGIEIRVEKVPLHKIYIRSEWVTGFVKVAVRSQLTINGLILIIGNDLASGKVFHLPEVIENPLYESSAVCKEEAVDLSVFPACVITRAQSQKFPTVTDLSDSFLVNENVTDSGTLQSDVCAKHHQPEMSASTAAVMLNLIALICYYL